MRFEGLSPVARNVPVIEIEAGGEAIDLYNRCSFEEVTLAGEALTFRFRSETDQEIALKFGSVRRLTVSQPGDWDPREATQIEHLLLRDQGPWPEVEFNAGGLKYEFDAESLAVPSAVHQHG